MRYTLLVYLVALYLCASCAQPDLVIPVDPSPVPMKQNYHTLLIESSCGPRYSFGQGGCSIPEDSDLTQHSFSILSPLGGNVHLFCREWGVDRPIFLKQGEKVTFRFDELVPASRGAEPGFCAFSVFSHWEKPPEIQTEVPLEGQSGKYYIRIRPADRAPATLSWTPGQGGMPSGEGILFAQFRELKPGSRLPAREPTLLNIKTTQSVDAGLYQLWNEPLKIGTKNQAYSGDQISVGRDTILGPAKKGSYALFGWALSAGMQMSFLQNDFVVAVDLYGWDTKKLSAAVNFTETEVCYETEATVALVVLSEVEEASNKVKGCFPRPAGQAVMAFFTNVGRAAYAIIEGQSVTWLQ